MYTEENTKSECFRKAQVVGSSPTRGSKLPGKTHCETRKGCTECDLGRRARYKKSTRTGACS